MFTSHGYGRAVSGPDAILEATRSALADMEDQLRKIKAAAAAAAAADDKTGQRVAIPGECFAVRINSGLFGVEWAKTKAILEAGGLDIRVVSRAADGNDDDAEKDDDKMNEKQKTEDGEDSGQKEKRGTEKRKRSGRDSRGVRKANKGTMDGWLKQR